MNLILRRGIKILFESFQVSLPIYTHRLVPDETGGERITQMVPTFLGSELAVKRTTG
jgi:hypothetical protein